MNYRHLLGENILPAVYVSPTRNVPHAELPASVRKMLRQNMLFSQRFTQMADARRRYFDGHMFQFVADVCMDERLLDIALAFGELDGQNDPDGAYVPPGIMEMPRTGGTRTSLSSLATCMIEDKRTHKHRQRELRLCLAHWSSSHDDSASCAAWKHDTKAAVGYVRDFASQMNHCYPGAIVAIHGLVDTDHDSVAIFGPGGVLDTMELVDIPDDHSNEADLIRMIIGRLRTIFPKTWGPIAALPNRDSQTAFYRELAEYLVHNIDYVRNNVEAHREIQLLEHAGRIICIGRHFEFLTEHNTSFIVDDHDANLVNSLMIGLKHVGRNNIIDADGGDRWVIPIHINIPHSGHDLIITGEYVLKLRESIRAIFSKARRQSAIAKFWLEDENGVPRKLHHRLKSQIEDGLDQRLAISVSISNRDTRLFSLDW